MKQNFLAILYMFLKHIYWPKEQEDLIPIAILPESATLS